MKLANVRLSHDGMIAQSLASAEDLAWAREIVRRGGARAYFPEAQAYHSHYDTVLRAGYRMWEFVKNNAARKGERVSFLKILRVSGRICLGSWSALRAPNLTAFQRVSAVARAPLDAASFAAVGMLELLGLPSRNIRRVFW